MTLQTTQCYETDLNKEESLLDDLKVFHMCPDLNEILSTKDFTSSIPLNISGDVADYSLKGIVEISQAERKLYFYLEFLSSDSNQSDITLNWSVFVYNTVSDLYLEIGKSVFNIKDIRNLTTEKLTIRIETVHKFIQENQLIVVWIINCMSSSGKNPNVKQKRIAVDDSTPYDVKECDFISRSNTKKSDKLSIQEINKASLDEIAEIIAQCQKQVLLNKAGIELLKKDLSVVESRKTNVFHDEDNQDLNFSKKAGDQPVDIVGSLASESFNINSETGFNESDVQYSSQHDAKKEFNTSKKMDEEPLNLSFAEKMKNLENKYRTDSDNWPSIVKVAVGKKLDSHPNTNTKGQRPNKSDHLPEPQKSSINATFLHTGFAKCKSDTTQRSTNVVHQESQVSMSVNEKSGPDIDLLMIGKSGIGKSALGNTILRYKAFVSDASATSVTKEVTFEVTEYQGRKIKVVDAPGVGDTDWSDDRTTEFFADKLADAIAINPRGYHAFLLVVRFDGRFTKEDRGTIEYLKKIFGKDFVKRYCILVMTCGDHFEDQVKGDFQQWLNAQKGVLAELVQECSHRTILIDNKTADEAKKSKQLNYLIQMVDATMLENCLYTNEQFEIARSERDVFILNSKKTHIREEAMTECNIIIQLVKQGQEKLNNDNDKSYLEELLHRANTLYDDLATKDEKSGAINDVVLHVRSVRNSISDEIRVRIKMAYVEKRIRQENEKLEEEITRPISIYLTQRKRLNEIKAPKFERELQSQWTEERKMNYEEFKRILVRTQKLEEENKTLRKKGNDLFAAIKRKVAQTLKKQERIPTEHIE